MISLLSFLIGLTIFEIFLSLFNSNQNIKITKIGAQHEAFGMANMPKESGNISTYGEMGGRNIREAAIECSRNQGQLLTAFNNNPYTHSLQSVA